MREFSKPHFVILGHKGFVGQSLLNFLTSTGEDVRIIEDRITVSNIPDLLTLELIRGSTVLNCIASGVTPGTGNVQADIETNVMLLKKILDRVADVNARMFIHFGSNYELSNYVTPLSTRSSYVQSKLLGSSICSQQIGENRKVRLVYLPTVIGSIQPVGRFFADFISSSRNGGLFSILHPDLPIEISTIASVLKQLDLNSKFDETGILEILPDLRITVYGFANLLNEALLRVGANQVCLKFPHGIPLKLDANYQVDYDFTVTTDQYIREILER